MSCIVKAISIQNYRGFKEEQTIELANSGNICFLVGQNNTGKSLIARSINFLNGIATVATDLDITDNEFHNTLINEPIRIKFEIDKEFIRELNKTELLKLQDIHRIILHIEIVKGYDRFTRYLYIGDGEITTHSLSNTNTKNQYDYDFNEMFENKYSITKRDAENSCTTLLSYIRDSFLVFAPIRNFHSPSKNSFYLTGKEIVGWISQNRDQAKIKSAKTGVRKILEQLNLDDPVSIKIDKDDLIFTFEDDLELTSNDVGTGYTMIYILLMEIMRSQKKIVLIDEIESHLQPGLIRELIKILREKINCQLVIATHSPTVIESATENDLLYRFQKIKRVCQVNKFYKGDDSAKLLRSVCNDLGVIPGDALLSNCVIWVEGPSEVLWLRAWMKNYLPLYKVEKKISFNIIEGLHYTILMTGGSLISHLSYTEENIPIELLDEDDNINVLRVNPNPFVIIDSDNCNLSSKKFKRIIQIAKELNNQNKTHSKLKYIEDKITDTNIHEVQNLWLLRGRELENYCHPELLKKFYMNISKKSHSKIDGISDVACWDVYSESDGVGTILSNRGITGVRKSSGTIIHKSKLAHYVFTHFSPTHFEDNPLNMQAPNKDMIENLRHKLDCLFNYISLVNSLS